jgi:hypothetical protein
MNLASKLKKMVMYIEEATINKYEGSVLVFTYYSSSRLLGFALRPCSDLVFGELAAMQIAVNA